MNHHIYRDPLKAIGNAEDNRVDDPDEPVASLVGLNRGILAAVQSGGGGGGGGTVGGATAANQVTGNASLASIDTKMNSPLPAGTNVIGTVGAQYNTTPPTFTDGQQAPLQTDVNGRLLIAGAAGGGGDATAANQVTANASLSSIDTKLTSQATAANQATAQTSLTSIDTKVGAATPAGTNLMGKVSAGDDTSTIYNGTTVLTPKFAVIDHAVSGDNTIVPVVASKKIRVLSLFLIAAGAVNVRFESGASGTALTGQMNLPTNGGFVLPYNPIGWFETAAGALLNLELSAAVSVDGSLAYVEV